jgi:predicted esterase
MKFFLRAVVAALMICSAACQQERKQSTTSPTTAPAAIRAAEIPALQDIAIDGDPADWANNGLQVDVLRQTVLRVRPLREGGATFRLAWDQRGLLVLVTVTDSSPTEAETIEQAWEFDSVEMFMAPEVGGNDQWQLTISPGIDPRSPGLRTMTGDFRKTDSLKSRPLNFEARSSKTSTGYIIEALLPWDNLAINPSRGTEIGFQIYCNNSDGRINTASYWYPEQGTNKDSKKMYALRLSDRGVDGPQAVAWGQYELYRRARINVVADRQLAGKAVEIREGPRVITTATLQLDATRENSRAIAMPALPMPPMGKPYGQLTVVIDGRAVASTSLMNVEMDRTDEFAFTDVVFFNNVFTSRNFPPYDFEDPAHVEDLLGNAYTLRATFYDAGYNEVKFADQRGRYGAIVDVTTDDGRTFKKFATLFRTEKPITREMRAHFALQLPEAYGINPALLQEQSKLIDDNLNWAMWDFHGLAPLLAALDETPAGAAPVTKLNDARTRDFHWWRGLKMKTGDYHPLQYLTHLPEGYDADTNKRWPLIIHLHGSSFEGTDLKRASWSVIPRLLDGGMKLPAVVITPQMPRRGGWHPEQVNDLLDQLLAKYRVDPDRVYLTGPSMGGAGTWDYAVAYPERLAAAVPICGWGDAANAARIKDLPVWIFHGDKDMNVNIEGSQRMFDALVPLGGRVRYTIYTDGPHGIGSYTYKNPEVIAWMLQQRRGQPAQEPTSQPTRVPFVPTP